MKRNDEPEFLRTMNSLAAVFSFKLTPEILEIYLDTLRDFTIEEFKNAAKELLKTESFMPKPAQFVALRKKADGKSPTESWLQILDNVKRSEYRQGRTVGGVADQAAYAVGGYSAIGMANVDELGFIQKRFESAYAELAESTTARTALALTQTDAQNMGPNIRLAISTVANGLKAR